MIIRRELVRCAALLMAPWLLVLCSCSNQAESPAAAPAAPAATPAAPASADTEKACQVEPVQHVVGRPYTPELGEEVRELSGSTVVRVLHPGEVVTMEFRFDRVNITVDAAGTVTQVTCG